ncbi:F-box protein [Globisporangium polare]
MTCVEALDDWFTFVDGKSQYYLRRTSSLAHFSRGQLVMWKLVCATIVFMLSVFLPCIVLPWEGFTSMGNEKIPPILYLGPFTALFTVISLWVSAVHLYQPTFTGPRFLSYHKKPYAYSWEMLDWIFYECSTTGTLVSFFSFWTISTMTEEDVSGIRVEGIIVQFAVVAVDFYHTAPQFKSNHVLLAMLWPSTWLLVQLLWVVGGHQPTNKLFNFHTRAAPLSTLTFYVGTVVSFFLLQWLSLRLQQHHEKRAREVVIDTQDNDSSYIHSPNHESMRMTQFELMIESSSNRLLRQMSSTSSVTNIAKSHTDVRDIVPAQVQLHPDTTTTIHIPSSRHQGSLSSNPLQQSYPDSNME